MAGLKLEPEAKRQKDSASDSAAVTVLQAEERGAASGLPLFLQNGWGRIQTWSDGNSGDPQEREAESVAQGFSRERSRSPAPRSAAGREPMPPAIRRMIEPALGADLSGVNVHSSPAAHRAAASLNARAFTTGRDIVLGEG